MVGARGPLLRLDFTRRSCGRTNQCRCHILCSCKRLWHTEEVEFQTVHPKSGGPERPSPKTQPQPFANRCGRSLHGVQRDTSVLRVEEAVKGHPAGFHEAAHGGLGQASLAHGLFDLPG